jgi:hypothetical protein
MSLIRNKASRLPFYLSVFITNMGNDVIKFDTEHIVSINVTEGKLQTIKSTTNVRDDSPLEALLARSRIATPCADLPSRTKIYQFPS